MSSGSLDDLLEKLATGDPAAAEGVFRTYEPYLRMVVRRQLSEKLRAKFDSIDIVQSVWADVLDGFRQGKWKFSDADHLRAFLVRATRNRFIDRLREHRRALDHELPLSPSKIASMPPAQETRPSEEVLADELWDQILDACPSAHYELMRLKRQGAPLAEIAARTGLHQSSVRRIIYDVARRLGLKRPAGSTDASSSSA